MTQKEKLARYDTLSAERDKLACALHDLVNGKFSLQVLINPAELIAGYDNSGKYAMRLSPRRGEDLFLVRYKYSLQPDDVSAWTENEIEDYYHTHPTSAFAQVLMHGMRELQVKYHTQAA